mgnify:CR=1 FL=1
MAVLFFRHIFFCFPSACRLSSPASLNSASAITFSTAIPPSLLPHLAVKIIEIILHLHRYFFHFGSPPFTLITLR